MLIITKKSVAPVKPKDPDPEFWHIVCICQRGNEVQHALCGTRMKGIYPTKKIPFDEWCVMCTSVTNCPVCKMPRQFKGQ